MIPSRQEVSAYGINTLLTLYKEVRARKSLALICQESTSIFSRLIISMQIATSSMAVRTSPADG